MKLYQKQYSLGQKSLEDITKSIKSYHGHLRYGNTYRLRKNVYGSFVLTRKDYGNVEDERSEKAIREENSQQNREFLAECINDSGRTDTVTAYDCRGTGSDNN